MARAVAAATCEPLLLAPPPHGRNTRVLPHPPAPSVSVRACAIVGVEYQPSAMSTTSSSQAPSRACAFAGPQAFRLPVLSPHRSCIRLQASRRIVRMNAAPNKGFGASPRQPQRAPSAGEQRRKSAASRYDQMAAAGMPEYTVWMRLKQGGVSDDNETMPWLPVGCLSVPRSSQVVDALFDAEQDLMQGAIRLYPNLTNEPRENIEFGYQLRQFDDEEIKVANRQQYTGIQGTLRRWFRKLQNPMNA